MVERTIWTSAAEALRPWRSAAGAAAMVLVAGQLGWRAVLLGRGYFTQDDFLMLTLGGRPMSVDLLMQDYSGHLFPGGFLVAWLHAHLAPLDWTVAVVEIVLLQLVASVLAWLVLCRLLPGSWWRLPVLAAYLFCPLSLWPTQWWAVAIQYLPVSIFLLLATWALLHRIQEGSRWSGPLVVAATVAGLLFQERAVLYPVVLGFVAVAFAEAAGLRRIGVALRSHLVVWVPLVVLLVGYVWVHRELAPIARTSPGSAAASAELVGNFVARNAVPGFVGGPWTDPGPFTIVVPADWAVVLSWAVVAVAVGWTLRRSWSAGWGWLLLLVYLLVDAVLLFGGRTGPDFGEMLGLIPRYSADAVPVLVVGLGLVARAVAADSRPARVSATRATSRWRPPPPLPLALAACYLGSSAISTAVVAPHSYNVDDRAYVESIRTGLRAEPRAVLYDGIAPDNVMVTWFGDLARVSTVVGSAPEDPVFDLPTYAMRIVDATGRLRSINLVGTVSDVRTRDRVCVHRVDADRVTRVELAEPSAPGKQVVRISYYTSASGFLRVTTPDGEVSLPLRTELNVADLVVEGPVEDLGMRLDSPGDAAADATVCVVDVVVGFPTPGQ
jgi:hypothetical protein